MIEEIQQEKNNESSAFESGARPQYKPLGNSGTEIFSGYFTEEYLQKLRGRRGAKTYDEIRRSEAQVAMLLNAIMNPIKAAVSQFEAAPGVTNSELHKEFIEFNAKDCIDWETHLHEALTMLVFGYSLFETIHSVVFNHEKFGTFNGLRALAYRSQKTIERWIVEPSTGELQAVEQLAMGDVAVAGSPIARMDAKFLLVFTLQKEGDNYEGISALRPMFGPWFRKNLYLKITGIGLEKHAMGTVVGTIPAGQENSEDFAKFKELLENFTAHESAFLIKPAGWEIEIVKNDFDASKVKEIIVFENTEMINSLVANFLALGQSGAGGSFALGSDLSDFFLTGIQNYANIIAGVWNRKLIPDLIKMNFGPQKAYPKLKFTGINDKAGKELADILAALTNNKMIKPDMKLEEFLRDQYRLPKADPTTAVEVDPQPAPMPNAAAPVQLHERLLLGETYKQQWKSYRDQIKGLMQINLKNILGGYSSQVRKAWKTSNPNARRNLALQLEPRGVVEYKKELRELLAEIANKAMDAAKKETPTARKLNIKLSESIQLAAPRGGYFEALPSNIKNIIKNQAELIASTHANDLGKAVSFQFLANAEATDDADQVIADVASIVVPAIEDGTRGLGMSIDAAAGNAVSTAYNQARLEWFFEPEVLETIESFTFYNEDPQSEICQELDGMTWAVGDPDLDRYTPPLHHNCKSRLVPNEKGAEGNPKIDRGGTAVSESALKSMTLHDCTCTFGLNLAEVQAVKI